MTDQAKSDRKDESGSPRKEESSNGGRNSGGKGSATPRHDGPSTNTIDEGLEGAILDPDENPSHHPLGAGMEATEGMYGADGPGSDSTERGGLKQKDSEPLKYRDRNRSANYGGEMGEPRKED